MTERPKRRPAVRFAKPVPKNKGSFALIGAFLSAAFAMIPAAAQSSVVPRKRWKGPGGYGVSYQGARECARRVRQGCFHLAGHQRWSV